MRRRHTLRSRRDHPRSRGENFVIEIVSMRTPGSSPLMRGKHGHVSNWQNPHGLIPTHAGKTLARAARSRQRGAHPRSHGENQPRVRRHTPPPGSSPLTRRKPQDVWIERLQERLIPTHAGKRSAELFEVAVQGLIPTHAGKTWSATERSPSRTAHPRSHGENLVLRLHENHGRGSSPLTRGKPGRVHGVTESLGLIPAHAGKTPPRDDGRNLEGLIPAHAGKTGTGTGSVVTRGAHPHSCGENLIGVTADLSAQGSSPLTRGNLRVVRAGQVVDGLIPAHAGKTRSAARRKG